MVEVTGFGLGPFGPEDLAPGPCSLEKNIDLNGCGRELLEKKRHSNCEGRELLEKKIFEWRWIGVTREKQIEFLWT